LQVFASFAQVIQFETKKSTVYKLQVFASFVQVIQIETKKSTVYKLQVTSVCIIRSSHSNWDEKIDSEQVRLWR
jgi:hypothetical protein